MPAGWRKGQKPAGKRTRALGLWPKPRKTEKEKARDIADQLKADEPWATDRSTTTDPERTARGTGARPKR